MSIPFIRQYPGGRGLQEFTCARSVEDMARRFIASGGRYLVEILPDGLVRVAACLLVDGEQRDVEDRICKNGPELREAVEALIIDSIRHVPFGVVMDKPSDPEPFDA